MLYENSSPIRKSAAYVNSILKNLIYWWRITNEPYSGSEQHKFPIFIVTNFAFPTFYMSLENWTTGKFGFDTPAQKNLWLEVEKERKVITSYVERAMRFAIQLFFCPFQCGFPYHWRWVSTWKCFCFSRSGTTTKWRDEFWTLSFLGKMEKLGKSREKLLEEKSRKLGSWKA